MARTTGETGISVGTSLALEGDLRMMLRSVDNVLINLRTIVRNAIETYPAEDSPTVAEIVAAVRADLIGFVTFVEQNRGARPLLLDVYLPSYRSLSSRFKHAILKVPKTDLQKAARELQDAVIKQFLKENKGFVNETDCDIKSFVGKALIFTHHVVDLTFTAGVTRLYLVESYTGNVKSYVTWQTKLTGGSELHNIPFNRLSLQIYGDKSTDFFGHSPKVKKLFSQIALNNKWSTSTTYEKVKADIRRMPEGVDRAGLMMMF